MDNSGRKGDVEWHLPDNVERTLEILEKIATMVQKWIEEGIRSDTFYGIELLNEPLGQSEKIWSVLKDDFYPRGYAAIRNIITNTDIKVVIEQAFKEGRHFLNYMSTDEGYTGVNLDMHLYHAFGSFWNDMAVASQREQSWQIHVKHACHYASKVNSLVHGLSH